MNKVNFDNKNARLFRIRRQIGSIVFLSLSELFHTLVDAYVDLQGLVHFIVYVNYM